MFLGLLIESISFSFGWTGWLMSFGHFLVALAGTLSAGLWLYTWVRIWVLVEASVKANETAKAVVHEVTRPLPSSPIELPLLLDQVLANRILQGVMSGLAAVAFGSMYAGFFPVYTSLAGLFVSITAVFVIAFAMYNPTTTASTAIRKWLVPVAVIVIVINTALCVFSYDAERFYTLRDAENRSGEVVTTAEVSRINMLQQKRARIVQAATNRGAIEYSAGEQELLNQIDQEIRDTRFPMLRKASGVSGFSMPRMNGKNTVKLAIVLAVLAFAIPWRGRKASAGH